ncbi:MAG: SpoIID/LytB domain-containing protein [Lachnospiraceae bacterium]|nr:SpoIID/LytB domain-containing protein [Lachnospiraceae bacterium]
MFKGRKINKGRMGNNSANTVRNNSVKRAVRNNIIFWIIVFFFPCACCLTVHLIDKDIVIGQGGYSVDRHKLNKNIMLEINGFYKSIDVEEYVVGVMAGVIPADYCKEALKAQAVLIRTNVLKEMEEKNTRDAADISYQYLTREDRELLWGRINMDRNERIMEYAVSSTCGKVIRKEDNLIMAMYHEVSIGKTADASEVLDEDISYLKSVDSSQDVEAKNYMNIYTYSWEKLGELFNNLTADKIEISIDESTENGFVKKVSAGGSIYTGQELADLLELPSINYYVEEQENGIRFVCLGKGSCLGLSQYGANYMASNGKTMEEIISYYYKDVSVEKALGN